MLYTFGCSYTVEQTTSSISGDISWPKWPKLLSQHLGLDYKNFGVSGAGNDQIFYHAVNEIVHNHNDIDTVAILWSAMWRFWIYGKNFNPVTDGGDTYINLLKELKYPNQATKFQINSFLKNITTLQKLCDDYAIQLYQWCGTGLMEYSLPQHKSNFPLVEQFVEELQKYNIDDTHIIGWPFIRDLGGMTFWDINKDMTISEKDGHPNAKGHELIARYFYENTKCKSKG